MADPATLPLRDIHLPPEPSWWPPAPGWWVLGALLLLGLVLLLWHWQRRRARRAWLRQARAELDALQADWQRTRDGHALLSGIVLLLRRVQRRMGWKTAAAASGQAWIEWLERLMPVPEDLHPLLREALYRPQVELDDDQARALIDFARQWLRRAGGRRP